MSDDFHIHPAARDEFHDTIRHYAAIDADNNGELAFDFEASFQTNLDIIIANPLLYSIRRGLVRRANLRPRFGEYYIAYMIWNSKVVVLAVAHAKRRPYYWRKRIGDSKKMF